MGNPRATPDPSATVNRTVTPRRPRNADLREREYLTPKEVDRLQDAARKHSRYGHRDATAILIAYRHGLRASELCELTWNMIELDSGRIHVRRAKNGVDSTHPLTGREIRALRQLRRENLQSRYVFNTERGGPVTRAWFLKMVRRTGELAKLPFPAHPLSGASAKCWNAHVPRSRHCRNDEASNPWANRSFLEWSAQPSNSRRSS